jgi:hypothetical protein
MLSALTEPSSCGSSPPIRWASNSSKPLRNVEMPLWVISNRTEEWIGSTDQVPAGICVGVWVVIASFLLVSTETVSTENIVAEILD